MLSFFSKSLPQITAEEIKNALDSKENARILDVRTPEEYHDGHIYGSILLPVDKIKEKIENVLPNKDQKIYVHCRSGIRSTKATKEMLKLGYSNVHNMQGGIMAWQDKGYPVSK